MVVVDVERSKRQIFSLPILILMISITLHCQFGYPLHNHILVGTFGVCKPHPIAALLNPFSYQGYNESPHRNASYQDRYPFRKKICMQNAARRTEPSQTAYPTSQTCTVTKQKLPEVPGYALQASLPPPPLRRNLPRINSTLVYSRQVLSHRTRSIRTNLLLHFSSRTKMNTETCLRVQLIAIPYFRTQSAEDFLLSTIT